jgi:DNA polymerase-3 subunit gamma/tau
MRASEESTARSEALDNPLVQAILAAFPAAKITAVRAPDAPDEPTGEDTLGGDASGEDWDPFEDD